MGVLNNIIIATPIGTLIIPDIIIKINEGSRNIGFILNIPPINDSYMRIN